MSNRKIKTIDILIVITLVLIFIVISLIFLKYYLRYNNEKNLNLKVREIQEDISNKEDNSNYFMSTKYYNYDVIGIIKIEKINLCYPILDSLETDALNKSVIKFFEAYNTLGVSNITIAGHNNYDGTMFGNLTKLEKGDIIQIIDDKAYMKNYEIYDTYVTDPMDVSYTIMDEGNKTNELTLVTCKSGNSKRYIVKARECV